MLRGCFTVLVLLGLLTVLLPGCTSYNRERGVENTWRQVDSSQIVPGTTTQRDILTLIGPPSQIINLDDGTVFYYLTEQTRGGGVILILFNRLDEKTVYDRAVFFFDRDGVLAEYSLSREAVGRDEG